MVNFYSVGKAIVALLALRAGDAKIFRNAGARVTDDALRSLVLATNLLAVEVHQSALTSSDLSMDLFSSMSSRPA